MSANTGKEMYGRSFAWQLATGFLTYILPTFLKQTKSTLLDSKGCIKSEIVHQFGLNNLDPKQVLVLPKYFLLIDERIVTGELSIAMNPRELFPGCEKISRDSRELWLEFDSPGYKKRIATYLLNLEQPLTTAESSVSHVIIFAGYAAPMFVMQKLEMTKAEKKSMLKQFTDELQLIVHHPRSNELLCEFSDCSDSTGQQSGELHLISVTDESSVRCSILREAESYLHNRAGDHHQKDSASDEAVMMQDLTLMSVSFAMAANTWIGFAQLLHKHMQSLANSGEQLPFDLPYCFVIPKSGRYPNEAKLITRLEQVGVTSEQLEFPVSNGRTYTFRVRTCQGRRMAFEIPASVAGIRKQAECSFGGVSDKDLNHHLAEFRRELDRLAAGADAAFTVIDWDDEAAGFPDDVWMEPSREFALSLINCLLT